MSGSSCAKAPAAGRASVIAFLSVDCHPVAADQPDLVRLRRLFAALADAAPEGLEGRKLAQLKRALGGVQFQMDEAAVAELDHHITYILGCRGPQRLEHGLDQAPILRYGL